LTWIAVIISGEKSIAQMAEEVLDFVAKVASGEIHTDAEGKGQEDFIHWKRGITLQPARIVSHR